MADDVTVINNSGNAGTDIPVATDEVGGKHVQLFKLAIATDGSRVLVPADATDGLLVNLGANNDVTVTGTVTVGSHAVTNAGTFAVQDATSQASLSVMDDWDESDRAKVNPIAGQAGVAAGAGAVTALTQRTTLASDDPAVVSLAALDDIVGVAHDAIDSGNPVKVGAKAATALPTAVASADRTNNISDVFGRQLVTHIDASMQVTKAVNVTTTQTGTDVWSPASGKKIAVTYLSVASYGTTAARVILWFGDNADTTYTAGTDQVLWAGSFAPSATSKPGMVISYAQPVFCTTADRELHLTTDAGISLDITVYGYEF